MSSKERLDHDDKTHSTQQTHQPKTDRQKLPPQHRSPILQRAQPNFTRLSQHDVLQLQRTLGNRAVSRLLAINKGHGIISRSMNTSLIQCSYDDVKKKAKKNQPITTQELEDAIKEFLVELVQGQGYQDASGNPVSDQEMTNVGFVWDMVYGAAEGFVTLPEQEEVIRDMGNGTLKMYLRHEMGHYIRSIATQGGDDTFQDAEDVIDDIDWDQLQTQYPTYLVDDNAIDRWKEEIRADLKSIRLQYREQRRFPTKSELNAYQTGLGASIDSSHPPAAFRVQTMKTFISRTKPAKCCYLTTACVEAQGLSDDCEELTVLRHFRDTYLLNKPHGEELIELYYTYSPAIVKKIDEDEERAAIYDFIYDVVCDCVDTIKREKMEYAYLTYCAMVVKLKELFIPDEQIPHYSI